MRLILACIISLLLVCLPLIKSWGKPYDRLQQNLLLIAGEAEPPALDRGGNEEPGDRFDRLEIITKAEVSITVPPNWRFGRVELLALLHATSYQEGFRWHRDVHSGKIRGDNGKAACLNQVHSHFKWASKERWLASMGTDLESTKVCFQIAADILAHYSQTCVSEWQAKNDLRGAFASIVAGYGTGDNCNQNLKFAQSRANLAMKWLKELEK